MNRVRRSRLSGVSLGGTKSGSSSPRLVETDRAVRHRYLSCRVRIRVGQNEVPS